MANFVALSKLANPGHTPSLPSRKAWSIMRLCLEYAAVTLNLDYSCREVSCACSKGREGSGSVQGHRIPQSGQELCKPLLLSASSQSSSKPHDNFLFAVSHAGFLEVQCYLQICACRCFREETLREAMAQVRTRHHSCTDRPQHDTISVSFMQAFGL